MTREECEEKVLYHLKEIRKITRKYTHRDCYVTMMLDKDGRIRAYNDATFEGDRTYPFEVRYKEGERNESQRSEEIAKEGEEK